MAYSIRQDLDKIAAQRRRLQAALATETDAAKIAKLESGLQQFDAVAQGYYDVQGSDGSGGTTMYAEGTITWVDQFLGGL